MSAASFRYNWSGAPDVPCCEVCDADLIGKRPHTRTCSTRCRVKLHRLEMKAKLAALQLDFEASL